MVKSLRQGTKGICILAGDVSPVDVIAHLPILCEEQDVPYIYVPSKQDLGYAALTKRPTSVVLVAPKGGAAFEHQDLLDAAISAVGAERSVSFSSGLRNASNRSQKMSAKFSLQRRCCPLPCILAVKLHDLQSIHHSCICALARLHAEPVHFRLYC